MGCIHRRLPEANVQATGATTESDSHVPSQEAPAAASKAIETPVTSSQDRQVRAITEEVQRLLEKGAIQEVSSQEEGFFSRLFLVPKKDQQMRPVINLRPQNQFLHYQHFKMEGIHVVKDSLYRQHPSDAPRQGQVGGGNSSDSYTAGVTQFPPQLYQIRAHSNTKAIFLGFVVQENFDSL